MKQIRKRLTYANVMSSLAVFLVLGGAAFAATQLPKNSVGAKQLKKNAVTTAKIKNNAVNGAKANEATFGVVPNAAHATNADKAATADKATTATKADSATTATKADSATTATKATTATTATSASSATTAEGPAAFAHVNSAGVVLAGRNVSIVAGTDPNYYCLTNIPFEPTGIQATADYWNGSPRFDTMVQVGLASAGGLGGTGCPAETQAFVHGVQADNDAASKAAFYVTLFH